MSALKRPKRRISWTQVLSILSHLGVALVSFQVGMALGGRNCLGTGDPPFEPPEQTSLQQTPMSQQETCQTKAEDLFPKKEWRLFIAGAARLDRKDFIKHYDLGVPYDETVPGNKQVLLLYTSEKSFPTEPLNRTKLTYLKSPEKAVENCDTLKVVLTSPGKDKECLAIMGQWESYHVHKLMRLGNKNGNTTPPLQYVSRTQQSSGTTLLVPSERVLEQHRVALIDYLQKLPDTRKRLAPLAAKAAGSDNTLIVMVCNFGQSELLFNFVCSARSRGLSLSKVLLFATDEATKDLGEALGITVFDVQDAFGRMPEAAARRYGDHNFIGMMMAKAYCVHLVNGMKHNVLFQDVDVVWYRDPLEYFLSPEKSGNFDIYFQDDGAHSIRYAPYSPNTGFYFVRYNGKTRYFFSTLARSGDMIEVLSSHQAALNALLVEHVSWRGLLVKILGRDDPHGHLFPGGFHYHRRLDFMRKWMRGDKIPTPDGYPSSPYIFHMSWTENKENKQKFLQQMGDWFVNETCVAQKVAEINVSDVSASCCAAEPILKCHYGDKPSKHPCNESDPIDWDRPPFW